jgi:hypothetical protein
MAAIRETVEQDYLIEHVREKFQCTVLWCEGRPCLEYDSKEQLDSILDYIKNSFEKDLLDVFFTAVESLPIEA